MPTNVMDPTALSSDSVTRHVIGQVVNAIASQDWDALATCVDSDVVYWRPGTSDRVDGVVDYVSEWRTFVSSNGAQITYRPHTVLVQGDTAMVEASAEGVANGKRIAYSMVSVLRVENGKLVEEREYIVSQTR